jgi:hypothetical protein
MFSVTLITAAKICKKKRVKSFIHQ